MADPIIIRRPALKLARPPQPPIEVERLEGEDDYHYFARAGSIQRLGMNWWQHPNYTHPPRHSLNPEVWAAARAPFLAEIAQAAAADRARNPLAVMQQQLRDAMKGS